MSNENKFPSKKKTGQLELRAPLEGLGATPLSQAQTAARFEDILAQW
jgi:hypothetical protein